MRVLFATAEYVTEANFDGGLANYIHRAALGLLACGHDPIVVVASNKNETFTHNGIEVHRVNVNRALFFGQFDRLTLSIFRMSHYLVNVGYKLNRRIREIHDEKPVDIIQFPHLGGGSLFKNIDIPAVIRLSSYTPLARAMGGYDNSPRFQIWQQEFLEKKALKKADGVFGPSIIISKIVEKEIGRKVEIIESPFLVDAVEQDETLYQKTLAGREYLLYFGTLSALKGIPTLAKITHELLSKYPSLHMVFVGKEQGSCSGLSHIENVRQRAGEHHARVLYFGQLHHDQLYPVIRGARAVVLPSRIDNFPNTCLEAMAHRKVVIGTRGTSFEQLIDDGVSGFLANIDDPIDLLTAVRSALDQQPAERILMEEKAAERMQRLRPEIAVKQLVEFYEKIIEMKGSSNG